MTAEQLRNSILQEAISGRLVPQDPNDEPASALLARIREEKALLVKEKKLKAKDIVVTPITVDDIPYEIPNSWEWVRVKELFNVCSARRVHEKDWRSSGIPFYRAREIGKLAEFGHVDNDLYIDQELYNEFSKSGVPQENDLMVTAVGTLGRVYVVKANEIFYYKDGSVLCMENRFGINAKFAKLVIESPVFVSQYIGESQGTTVATLTMVRMNEYLLPLPPLAEQKRIVAKLEELLPTVEQYGKAQTELDELNAALPARLRNSILQEAMQGKLTEHDLGDNWAKVYCEKLPKLKYKSSPEWPQEYPFELPENWEWCRIGDICELMNGYAFKSTQYKDTGVRVIRITNVQDGYIVDNNPKFYPQIPDIERYALKEGDLLMSLTGNVGRVGILPQSMLPAALNQRVACLRLKDERLKPFLFWYLRCPIFRERCEGSGHGMAQLNISTEWVKQEFFPLPPLAEQQRIVAKIEELFEQIDKISK